MSKLTEALRTIGVFNAYEFADKGNVFIDYTPEDRGRGGHGADWKVMRPGFQTDPKGPWYNYGNKAFTTFGCRNGTNDHHGAKVAALEAAKQWASGRYGIKEWDKTPFGTWMDAAFVKKRLAELQAQLKEKEAVAK